MTTSTNAAAALGFWIDANAISKSRGGMRAAGLSQDTVIGYLAEISRCLNWAPGIWQTYKPPVIRRPKRKKRRGPRGRPITKEEFERMLRAIKKTGSIAKADRASWRHFLVGLFLSGLRLSEALELSWDRTAKIHVCDLEAKRARIYFYDQKSHNEGRSPITRAFDRFLRKTPPERRRGPVFSPRLSKGRVTMCTASKMIAALGRSAGVVVGSRRKPDPKTGEPVTVTLYASAHDLRRTFATRLAPRVRSAAIVAMDLRDTIQIAETYYVGADLEVAESGGEGKDSTQYRIAKDIRLESK